MMVVAVTTWKFGYLFALYTTQGLRAVLVGSSASGVINQLNEPVKLAMPGSAIYQATQSLVHYIDNPYSPYPGDLDIQGTPFQLSVWHVLRTIPFGQIMTYAQIAERILRPSAYRAVANACRANPLPFVIPCHRALGTNRIGGYRLGVELKKALLSRENPKGALW